MNSVIPKGFGLFNDGPKVYLAKDGVVYDLVSAVRLGEVKAGNVVLDSATHAEEKAATLECKICGFACVGDAEMVAHMQEVHPAEVAEAQGAKGKKVVK
jgi:hypothetical protein